MMNVSDFIFHQNGTSRDWSCRVDNDVFPERLFFKAKANSLPGSSIPSGNFALIGLLYPAMLLGEDLMIDAPVSPILLYNAQHDIQSLLIDCQPKLLKHINVSATSLVAAPCVKPTNAATGFSAGVDTFSTLSLLASPHTPDALRIKSLTTFDVGAMGPFHLSEAIFEKYSRRTRNYAEKNDFDWQTVRSNLDEFFSVLGRAHASFQMTHVLRNIAAAFVLEDIFSHYHYSSSFPYRDIGTKSESMGFIEPMLLPLLSTETFRLSSAAAGLARYEKTELVSTYKPAMSMLDVCVASAATRMKSRTVNCSRCWKCSCTLLNLDLLGRLDDFAEVFDVAYYRSHKERAVLTVLERARLGKPAEQDLIALMQTENFDFEVSRRAALKFKLQPLIRRVSRTVPRRFKDILSGIPGLKTAYRKARGRH